MFKCDVCEKSYYRKDHLVRHIKTHNGIRFNCSVCRLTFTYKTNLIRHEKNIHGIYIFLSYIISKYLIFIFIGIFEYQRSDEVTKEPNIPAGLSNFNYDSDDKINMLALKNAENIELLDKQG